MYLKPNKRMKTIEQRAEEYVPNTITAHIFKSSPLKGLIVSILRDAYIAGAKEQKSVDIDKAKSAFNKACGWLSTYSWYNEVFEEFIKNIEE